MTESPAAHLLGWDCIEFWVGNARTTAGFLMSAFGFHCTAYAGPETGGAGEGELRARAGRHPLRRLRRAERRLPDRRARPPSRRRRPRSRLVGERCGRGVRGGGVAWCPRRYARRGPSTTSTASCGSAKSLRTATRCTRSSTAAAIAASCSNPATTTTTSPTRRSARPSVSRAIDHVVGNVEQGRLDDWVRFYAEVMGFSQLQHFDDEPDLDRVLGADVDGRVGRRRRS